MGGTPAMGDNVELEWGKAPRALVAEVPGTVGLAYLDLTGGRGWTLGDRPRPAASLVKLPLAIAAYQAAERGELDPREKVAVTPIPEDDEAEFDDLGNAPAGKRFTWRKVIDRMITESDNAATNALIDRLGLGALDDLTARLGLSHTTLRRRMLDAAAREAGRENSTTAREFATVLAALWRGELLGPAFTAELLGLLGQQRWDEKLAAGLPAFLHKTGELTGYRHDGGIVPGEHPYVLVALAEGGPELDAELARLARAVHAWHTSFEPARAWLKGRDLRQHHVDLQVSAGILSGVSSLPELLAPPAALGLEVQAGPPALRHGVVSAPLLQLRGGPGHARELVSQLRLGDPIEVLEAGEEWHRLRGPDGYVAWGKANNVLLDVAWNPSHMVVVPHLKAPLPHGRGLVLSAGARLESLGAGRYRLPDGQAVELADGLAPLGTKGDIEGVLAFAHAFLGLPYLWGGTTCWGLDCSGLVQLSYAVNGVSLPRDADQQQQATEPVAAIAALQRGDLIFFPGHVALSLGGSRFIHAAAKPCCVTINSFDPADPLYDEPLHRTFAGGGRSPLALRAFAPGLSGD